MEVSDEEYRKLVETSLEEIGGEIDDILSRNGYEVDFNISISLDAAPSTAAVIWSLSWDLVHTAANDFILSDRPLPEQAIGFTFSVPLTSNIAILLSRPVDIPSTTDLIPRPAQVQDVNRINADQRARATEWICGATNFVWQL